MTTAEVWAELEAELEWREAELRFLQNQVARLDAPHERDLLRRAVVVMLYAHFEGLCKFMFALYVRAVNELGLACGEASESIAAASLADVLAALRDPNRKCDVFRRELPDDSILHRFARDREFVAQTHELDRRRVRVPDSVVDVEDNLKPVVLKKILYRLGLEQGAIEAVQGDIHKLVNFRNGIAHGDFRQGVGERQYSSVRRATWNVMQAVRSEITGALRDGRYRRAG